MKNFSPSETIANVITYQQEGFFPNGLDSLYDIDSILPKHCYIASFFDQHKFISCIFEDFSIQLYEFAHSLSSSKMVEAQTAKRHFQYNRSYQTLRSEINSLCQKTHIPSELGDFLVSNIALSNNSTCHLSLHGGCAIVSILESELESFMRIPSQVQTINDFDKFHEKYIKAQSQKNRDVFNNNPNTFSVLSFYQQEAIWKIHYCFQILKIFSTYSPQIVLLKTDKYDKISKQIIDTPTTALTSHDVDLFAEQLKAIEAYSDNPITNIFLLKAIAKMPVELLYPKYITDSEINTSYSSPSSYKEQLYHLPGLLAVYIPRIKDLFFCFVLKECITNELTGKELYSKLAEWIEPYAKKALKNHYSLSLEYCNNIAYHAELNNYMAYAFNQVYPIVCPAFLKPRPFSFLKEKKLFETKHKYLNQIVYSPAMFTNLNTHT